MSLTKFGETSPAWPWIKTFANLLTIPGTKIGLQSLTELQDSLAEEEFRSRVKGMLAEIYSNTNEVSQLLKTREGISVQEEQLRAAVEVFSEDFYLRQIADRYFYADFKGIAQESKFVPLPLDEIFVDLKVVFEEQNAELLEKEKDLHAQFESNVHHRDEIVHALEELDTKRAPKKVENASPIGEALKQTGAVVMLGGPGTGKTTMIKRIARSCALGQEIFQKRYPEMTWAFPVVLPVTQYADDHNNQSLLDYIADLIKVLGGEPLLARYRHHLINGQILFLFDGLDEVAEVGNRISCARAVDVMINGIGKNRVLLTSRRIGYAICRLSTPATHCHLLPFSQPDVFRFVSQWHTAYEKAHKAEKANLAQAEKDAASLNDEITRNTGVASLATNPLMLTIIALIKHQSVILPERRVELYDVCLRTLLQSWNLARSLAQQKRPVGEAQVRIELTRELWSAVAYWMHSTANREVNRSKLQDKLVEILINDFDKDIYDAKLIAESYLASAAETSGLLEARGPNTFAFVHQTFQEYMAALFLSRPPSKAVTKIGLHAKDARWSEVIRLAAGHLGITAGEREILADVVNSFLNAQDPLEPILNNSLKLGLGCIIDQTGLRLAQIDKIYEIMINRFESMANNFVDQLILPSLQNIRTPPGPSMQIRLLSLVKRQNWKTRMHAVRLLGLCQRIEPDLLKKVEEISRLDKDIDVRSHAALVLWRHGIRTDYVKEFILDGLISTHTLMRPEDWPECEPVLLNFLASPEYLDRCKSAKILFEWKNNPRSIPALLELLDESAPNIQLLTCKYLFEIDKLQFKERISDVLVSLMSVEKIETWEITNMLTELGFHKSSVPLLIQALTSLPEPAGDFATTVLTAWPKDDEYLPDLCKVLQSERLLDRINAVKILYAWGYEEIGSPVLNHLAGSDDERARLQASRLLYQFGYGVEPLSILKNLLGSADRQIKISAAYYLVEAGEKDAPLNTLLDLTANGPAGGERSWMVQHSLSMCNPNDLAIQTLFQLAQSEDIGKKMQALQTLATWNVSDRTLLAHVDALLDLPLAERQANINYLQITNSLKNNTSQAVFLFKELDGNISPILTALFNYKQDLPETWLTDGQRKLIGELVVPAQNDSTRLVLIRELLRSLVILQLTEV